MDSWIRMLSLRFRALFRSGEKESEMEREMRFHLEHQIEENIESGMSPDEARKEAMKGFGNAECLKEDCRDSWGVRLLSNLLRNTEKYLRVCGGEGRRRGEVLPEFGLLMFTVV